MASHTTLLGVELIVLASLRGLPHKTTNLDFLNQACQPEAGAGAAAARELPLEALLHREKDWETVEAVGCLPPLHLASLAVHPLYTGSFPGCSAAASCASWTPWWWLDAVAMSKAQRSAPPPNHWQLGHSQWKLKERQWRSEVYQTESFISHHNEEFSNMMACLYFKQEVKDLWLRCLAKKTSVSRNHR